MLQTLFNCGTREGFLSGSVQELYFYMVEPIQPELYTLSSDILTSTRVILKLNVAYRKGMHGPYLLTFTTGPTPSGNIVTGLVKLVILKDTDFWGVYFTPGIYTMTPVAANVGTSVDVADAEPSPPVIQQIGEYDSTPRGFLNTDQIKTMRQAISIVCLRALNLEFLFQSE
ncbi:hypothetical protein NP233_g7359 [Leucocoprinus birnbaumii]|uniref:Uncharacterized protein n=1 Tax=Leucocoprinus birnbaumii TaxID=56174 RepID=A0AAD5YSV2_9AGAR|nr:hypothetical protein NP233_g7359 [Leucocoprinus birnbaumii]